MSVYGLLNFVGFIAGCLLVVLGFHQGGYAVEDLINRRDMALKRLIAFSVIFLVGSLLVFLCLKNILASNI